MKVSCHACQFDDAWDTLLLHLIENGEVVKTQSKHTIKFKLKTKKKLFGFIPYYVYSTYSVWIANKSSHYGTLHSVNGDWMDFLSGIQKAPSKETLEKLYELEVAHMPFSGDHFYKKLLRDINK